MSTRIESGRKAKLDGHKKEDALSKKLTEINLKNLDNSDTFTNKDFEKNNFVLMPCQ